MLNQFVVLAFVWAYSLRAQYYNVGWLTAQNYIMGNGVINSFNIYRVIADADTPVSLLSVLSDRVIPLSYDKVVAKKDNIEEKENDIFQNYLYYFKLNKFFDHEN